MTFDSNQAATQQEGVCDLYWFTAGGVHDYVTSWPTSISFLGHTFRRRPIKRSGFTTNLEFGTVRVTIEALLTPRFLTYIANHPIEPIQIQIYRAVATDLTAFALFFKGEVLDISAVGNTATSSCESGSRKMRTQIPRFVMQSFCNHDVFDSRCLLSQLAFRETVTIDTVSNRTLTSADASAFDNDYFSMGVLQWGTDYRLITNHTGSTLTIHTAFSPDFVNSTEVFLFPGCDGNPQTCIDKFNNLNHLLAMPYIPSHNPTVWGIDE